MNNYRYKLRFGNARPLWRYMNGRWRLIGFTVITKLKHSKQFVF